VAAGSFSPGRRHHWLTEGCLMNHRDRKNGLSFAAAVAALFLGFAWPHAGMAQTAELSDGPIACTDFQRGVNGTWTVIRPTRIRPQGVEMNLAPWQTFAKNQPVGGIDVTTVLDRHCGNL
jgi:hypothetical protein